MSLCKSWWSHPFPILIVSYLRVLTARRPVDPVCAVEASVCCTTDPRLGVQYAVLYCTLYTVQAVLTHTHNCFLRPSLLSVRVRQSGWEHVCQDCRWRRDVKRININAMWNESEFVNTGMFKIISVQNYCTINYLLVTFWLVNLFYTHSGAKMS